MNQTPDNKHLETLLSNIQAQPGRSLSDKLADAPWNTPEAPDDRINVVQFAPTPRRNHRAMWRNAAAIALVIVGIALFVTPIRTTADHILSWFFVQSDSNTRTDTFVRPEATPTMPPQAIQATLAAREASTPVMSELRRMADFEFVVPQYIPSSYELHDAYTRPNLVVLVYEPRGANPLKRHITLQMSYGEPHGTIQVGQDALLEQVTVDNKTIEYLRGSWEADDSIEENGVITLQSEWDSSIQIHRLMWYDDTRNIQYNMMYQAAYLPHPAYYGDGAPTVNGYLTRNDLITIAASVP